MDAPEIRYAVTKDRMRIAYGCYGGEGFPVVNEGWPGATPLPMRYRIPGHAAHVAAMAASHTVYELDHRGTGYSSQPITSLSMDDWVADLEAVVEAVGPPVDIFGGSAGCFPVVHLAAARPSLFRRIVLANPAVAGDAESSTTPLTDTLSKRLPPLRFREVMIREAFDHVVTDEQAELLARLWADGQTEALVALHLAAARTADIRDALRCVESPTFVVADPATRDRSWAVAQLLPNARFLVWDGQLRFGERTGRLFSSLLSDVGHRANPESTGDCIGLSEREAEVLRMLAAGLSNGEIAAALCLSTRTVERHAENIYAKLGVHNRTAAANWAIRNGLA